MRGTGAGWFEDWRRGTRPDEEELDLEEEPFPVWGGEPEASYFEDEIGGRGEEVVLVTRSAAESAALREWGLLAIARPGTGRWCAASFEVLEGRDLAFVDAAGDGEFAWAASDVRALAGKVRRIGLLRPEGCRGERAPRDLVAFAAEQRARGVGPQVVAEEARACLVELPPAPARAKGKPKGAEGEDDWPTLLYGRRPPVEPFPVDVLPAPVARFVREAAEAVGAPMDFVGLPVLIAAGAAIGRSVALQLKPGYCVSPALFGLSVGGPSSGMSPALAAALRPLRAIDEALERQYQEERAEYDRAAGAARESSTGLPEAPVFQAAVLEDVALEALGPQLARSPRGLLVARDDGAAWVARLSEGRGEERRLWFSGLLGTPLRLRRGGGSPTRLGGPFLAFCGNLSPHVLGALGGRDDGLLERVLFAFPDLPPRPYWSERGLSDEAKAGWANTIDRLRARAVGVGSDGAAAPRVIALAADAQPEWVRWYNAQADAFNAPGADVGAVAAEAKLCDFAARLALVLHLLDLACPPSRGAVEPVPPLGRSALLRALRLCAYFRSQHRRARWVASGGPGSNGVARAIVEWARRAGKTRFSVSELKCALRWLADRPGEPEGALRWLEDQHAIVRQVPRTAVPPRKGRPGSAVYEVHPGLRGQEIQEMQENAETR